MRRARQPSSSNTRAIELRLLLCSEGVVGWRVQCIGSIPEAPNYPFRHPKYHLVETTKPLMEARCGAAGEIRKPDVRSLQT